jgi:hypothetical protein
MSTKLTKTAVDSAAEKYWKEYFAESGYGAEWVRKIPKRIKAALESSSTRTASLIEQSEPQIAPLSYVISDNKVTVEGVARFPHQIQAWVVDFDHEGKLIAFDSIPALAKAE